MKITNYVLPILASILAVFAFGACEKKTPAEEAGDAVEKAGEAVGDAVEEIGDAVKDATN